MRSTSSRAAPVPMPVPVPHGIALQRPMGMAAGTVLLQPQQVSAFPGFSVAVPAPGGYIMQQGRAIPGAAVTSALTAPGFSGQQFQLVPQAQQGPYMSVGHVLQPAVHQQAAPMAVLPVRTAPQAVMAVPPPSPPPSQWPYSQHMQQQQPAQQQQQQRPMQRRSASPLPHPPPPPKTKAMSPLTSNLTAGNITANQLDKLLINLASGGLFADASSPPPEDDPAVKTTSFSASFIKVAFKRQGCCFSMLCLQQPPSNLSVSLHSMCSFCCACYVYQAWPPLLYRSTCCHSIACNFLTTFTVLSCTCLHLLACCSWCLTCFINVWQSMDMVCNGQGSSEGSVSIVKLGYW